VFAVIVSTHEVVGQLISCLCHVGEASAGNNFVWGCCSNGSFVCDSDISVVEG